MTQYLPEPGLRVSTAEREPVIDKLKDAYAEGRLEYDEFDSRLQLAMLARTRRDLAAITADLLPRPLQVVPAGSQRLPRTRAVDGEDRVLAAVAHATALAPILVGPLVLMLTSGRRSPYVRHHAVEALNFQLTLLLVTIMTFGIGGILYAVAWLFGLIGSVVALTGQPFRYPLILDIKGGPRGATPGDLSGHHTDREHGQRHHEACQTLRAFLSGGQLAPR